MTSLPMFRDAFFAPVREEFDRLFDQFFGPDSLHSVRSRGRSGYPKLDVIETDKEYVVEVEVPGVDPDQLQVEIVPWDGELGLDRKVLKLRGKKDYDFQYPEGTTWHMKEMRRAQFTRELLLPEYVDSDSGPDATYEKGILKLVFEKPEESEKAEPRTIPITKRS
ncbi:unnamed protein product, partial [marine sediment metagenome]